MGFRVGVVTAAAVAVLTYGCGNNSQRLLPADDAPQCDGAGAVDSELRPDAVVDARVDAWIAPDVRYDAAPTCPLTLPDLLAANAPLASPACTSGATQIYDVGNYRIMSMATLGDLLYVGWYETYSSGIQTGGVEEYNLVTNTHRPVLETFGGPVISQSNGHIWVADTNDDRVWLLGPGLVPTPVIYNSRNGAYFQSDATHLYWVATEPSEPTRVYREPICGGARETLMECDTPRGLQLVGDDVYCGSFINGGIFRVPKSGGEVTTVIGGGSVLGDFEVVAGQIIVQEFNGRLYKMDLTTSVITNIAQVPGVSRTAELLVSDLHYYLLGSGGIYRVPRNGAPTLQRIYAPALQLPAATFAKGGLIFVRPDSFVERCVN